MLINHHKCRYLSQIFFLYIYTLNNTTQFFICKFPLTLNQNVFNFASHSSLFFYGSGSTSYLLNFFGVLYFCGLNFYFFILFEFKLIFELFPWTMKGFKAPHNHLDYLCMETNHIHCK